MIKNSAESIRQRLLNLARKRDEDFDYILRQYVIQRLLYRLSQTGYQKQFLLKGAQLFWIWNKDFHRPTRDVDLLGFGDDDVQELVKTFQEICSVKTEDGLQFDTGHIEGLRIKEDAVYQGVRITGFAELARARVPFQADIGFGDIVIPEPEITTMPSFLDLPEAEIRAYSVYTVIAEKFQAMIYLGLANSRMKDFYDVWYLASGMDMEGVLLVDAIKATFNRRKTEIPEHKPLTFTKEFYNDETKKKQWSAFLRKNRIKDGPEINEIMGLLECFLMPPIVAIKEDEQFIATWNADKGWEDKG